MTTDKQKKILLIVAAVFIGSYVVRYVVNFVANAAYSYQARAAQAAKPEPKPQPPAPPTTQPPPPTTTPIKEPALPAPATVEPAVAEAGGAPAPSTAPPISTSARVNVVPAEFAVLSGAWRGTVAIAGRGLCGIHLTLNESVDAPGHYGGTIEMKCNSLGPLTSADRSRQAATIINKVNPQASILSGALENDAIRMKADKVISSDTHGCFFGELDISPFGNRQVAVQWKENPPCAGGNALLSR